MKRPQIDRDTLFERVVFDFEFQAMKHGDSSLPGGSVEAVINSMSQYEFLERLSDALEEILKERSQL